MRALRRSDTPVPGATETVTGDAGDLEPHLDGIDTVYFIWPNFTAGESEGMARAIEAVTAHGRLRVVYHSVLRPGLEAMPHHWDKLRAEERLAESQLDTVTLQPCSYMQNIEPLLDTVRETGLYQPLGGLDAAISFVDLADISEVAVRACFDDDMLGGAYELSGPQPLTARDVAAELSRTLARPVTAREIKRRRLGRRGPLGRVARRGHPARPAHDRAPARPWIQWLAGCAGGPARTATDSAAAIPGVRPPVATASRLTH